MKNLIITFLAFIISLSAPAQYKVDWANAPLNQIPKEYTRDHFKISGEVSSQLSRGLKLTFNQQGLVTSFSSGSTFNYNSKGLLISQITIYGSTYYSNDEQGRTFEYHNVSGNGSEFRYNDRGLWSEELNRETKELILRFSYDQHDRVIKREYFNQGKIATTTLYSYKKTGNELEVTKTIQQLNNPEKIEVERYNDRGDCTLRDGKSIKYTYDQHHNIISMLDGIFPITSSYTYFDAVANTPEATTVKKTDCISGDCENGYAVKTFGNVKYYGFFEKGKQHGPGMLFKENYTFLGVWKNGVNIGYGMLNDKNTEHLAEGYFENLVLNGRGSRILKGKGTFGKFSAGNLIAPAYKIERTSATIGCTAGDCVQQYGLYIYANGSSYIGFFKDGNPEAGNYSDAEKNKYNGEYINGKPDGFGRQMFSNGDYYLGFFINGMRNGKGFYSRKGTPTKEFRGLWQNDKFIKDLSGDKIDVSLLQPTPPGPGILSNQASTIKKTTTKVEDLGFGNAAPDLNNIDNSAVIRKLYPEYSGADEKFIANKISAEAAKKSSEDESVKYIAEKIEELFLLKKEAAFDAFIYVKPSEWVVKSQKLLAPETRKYFFAERKRITAEYLKKNPQR